MKKYLPLLVIALLFSCTNRKITQSDFVLSHSDGVIGVKMPVYIDFADSVTIDSAMLAQIVTIKPDPGYHCELLSSNRVKIVPKEMFDYDVTYEVCVDLNKVTAGREKALYCFNVETRTPDYLFKDKLLSIHPDVDLFFVSGEVIVSDYVDPKYIEQNFSVKGTERPIRWVHSLDGMHHSYTVDSLEAKKEDYTVALDRDYHEKNRVEIIVPKLGEYRILGYQIETEPLSVVVAFSSRINPNQQFQDLVKIGNLDLRFNVIENKLYIYPSEMLVGSHQMVLRSEIENERGDFLSSGEISYDLIFPEITPSIRFLSKGSILPSSNNMTMLFQSVNYAKARVRVKKIYSNNLLQFFQFNNYDTNSYLEYVSAVVKDTTITLAPNDSPKLRSMNNYALNLSELITADKGAMYRIEIRGIDPFVEEDESYDYEYYFGDYKTYADRSRNILQSDIGIIAKGDDNGQYAIFATDMLRANPLSGAAVKLYNKVNQQLGEGVTDRYGKALISSKESPFIAVVSNGDQTSYLKMEEGLSLPLSNFDVAGSSSSNGIKGYIFGERGVWRPGDEIHLTFIVTSTTSSIPENHPATLTLRNPQGQIIREVTKNSSSDGMYCFKLQTSKDAPTGNWSARITFGSATFERNVKIETIKPNRLKIDLKLNDKPFVPADRVVANVETKWLHGAIAADLNVTINVELSKNKTQFEGYKEYVFDDLSKQYTTQEMELFKMKTDQQGKAVATGSIEGLKHAAPGVMNAKFTVKVFEKSGDFSIDQLVTKLSPYSTYIGIRVEEEQNSWGEKYLDISKSHDLQIVALNDRGEKQTIDKVKVQIYRMEWNWWWDSSSDGALASYAQDSYNEPFYTTEVELHNGEGKLKLQWESNDYGLYLVRVSDPEGGHSAVKVCYVDSGYGRNSNGEAQTATRLSITKDKESYAINDRAVVTFPSAEDAKALISIESGTTFVKNYWVDCQKGRTNVPIELDRGMSPNVYVHVTMLQPHNNTLNDAPLRMYGVVKLRVSDKNRKLTPVIGVSNVVKPETEFALTVKEQNGKPMSYVVAIVDEGLLDITRFRTPDPWGSFNADEAIGVRTWDLFDQVIGAYGGRIEQQFAIGGDDEIQSTGKIKAERFKPIVHFIEAQKLKANATATHKIKLPPYFGSVRVMVIATNGEAQGSAEKKVSIKKPLMVQATMPRVISTQEEILLPVTLFAMEDGIGNVTVQLSNNSLLNVVGGPTQTLTLNRSGEAMVYFRLKAGTKSGVAKIKVTATAKGDVSSNSVEIDVRNPNPTTIHTMSEVLEAGATKEIRFPLLGIADERMVKIECSTTPAINLSKRLKYLTDYPHGCIEQITSGAFPQLYIGDVMSCSAATLGKMERNVKSTLERLNQYQLGDGAFAYWKGGRNRSNWGTIYATHFIVEAAKRGYSVSEPMKKNAKNFLKRENFSDDLEQAYALYVLALDGSAERGKMNRLREKKELTANAKCFLAGAYVLDRNEKVARDIVATIGGSDCEEDRFNATFNTPEREMAVLLTVLNKLGDTRRSFEIVNELAKRLNDSNNWLSTQSIAWALNSISESIVNNRSNGLKAVVRVNGKTIPVHSDKAYFETEIDCKNGSRNVPLTVTNNGTGKLFVVVSSSYIPQQGEETAKANGLALDVKYVDFNGKPLNPKSIVAGTDFQIEVTVRNTSSYRDYTNLALTHIIPSGWEISNDRLNGDENAEVENQDIRDARVYTYFNLRRGEQKRVKIKVTATYTGKFYLPAIYCEAMYDGTVNASTKGEWTEVVR